LDKLYADTVRSGGKFGEAAVLFFKWQLKGDTASGAAFLKPQSGPLAQKGWDIVSKNWIQSSKAAWANTTAEIGV
jgi:hypothetical protein